MKDVKDGNHLDKQELEIYLNKILEDPSLLTITGSHTNEIATWTTNITNKIKEKASTATVRITTANDSNPKTRTVTIEVDNLPDGIGKITKTLNHLEHSKPLGESDILETIIQEILMSGIEASHLHENMSLETALIVLQAEADKIDSKTEVHLQNPTDSTKVLRPGLNQINVVLKKDGKNSTPFIAKLKNVHTWTQFDYVQSILEQDIFLKENHTLKTFEDIIFDSQLFINNNLKENTIKVTLKNSNEKNKLIRLGFNEIAVILTDNHVSRTFVIKIHNISENAQKIESNPNSFPKLSKYLTYGISSINDLKMYFTTRNTVGQMLYEIDRFLQWLDPEIAIYPSASSVPQMHQYLVTGVNKIKIDIYRGTTISEFTIIFKDVSVH